MLRILRKAIDQGTDESEFVDGTVELVRRGFRVLQRERGERTKSIRSLSDLFGALIIDAT